MASITKRQWTTRSGEQKEAWVVRYADQSGKWRLKTFAKKADADNWLTDTKSQVKAGTHTADSTSMTLDAACKAWIKRGEAERLEHTTMRQRRLHVHHILALLDGDTKLSRYSVTKLEAFRDDLLLRYRRPTARKVIVSLRSILKQAKAVHLASADLTVKANGRHERKLKVGVDIPTAPEVKAMIEAAEPKARALVCLAAFAGLRASELRGLAWSHLDLGNKPTVTIEERADETGAIGSPKSGAARRTIKLNPTTVQALKEWKLAQPHGRRLVFGTRTDRPDALTNIVRRVFCPAMVKAAVVVKGEPKYTGLHCLRHFAVSSWLKTCNGDLKAVQTKAGHAALALTLDTYGHLLDTNDDDQIAAAEKLVLG
jgi:integrase